MIDPLVSIGLPVRNGADFIRRALDSLLAQDYPNFELIVSDNASSDGTWEIFQEYADRDDRIRLLRYSENQGANENYRRVLHEAQGSYFMWAAADDYWAPGFVSALVKELEEHPESGVTMCAIDVLDEHAKPLYTVRFEGAGNPNNMSRYELYKKMNVWTTYHFYIYGLFRTELLRKAFPLIDPHSWAPDIMFMCQIALATRFRYVDQVLHVRTEWSQVAYERHPDMAPRKIAYKDKGVWWDMLGSMSRMILRSPIIPWYRKFLLPAGFVQYLPGLLSETYLFVPLTEYWKHKMPWRPEERERLWTTYLDATGKFAGIARKNWFRIYDPIYRTYDKYSPTWVRTWAKALKNAIVRIRG
ncbi:MAG: glycosyltransferase family A protein [Thermodesulfobacteriota bacterium]